MSSYFNAMERIRKLANFPNLVGGVPPKGHRKCSDWASYTTAVDNVTREMVAELLACKEAYAKLAGAASELAGQNASLHEQLAETDKKRIGHAIDAAAQRIELSSDQREQLIEAAS